MLNHQFASNGQATVRTAPRRVEVVSNGEWARGGKPPLPVPGRLDSRFADPGTRPRRRSTQVFAERASTRGSPPQGGPEDDRVGVADSGSGPRRSSGTRAWVHSPDLRGPVSSGPGGADTAVVEVGHPPLQHLHRGTPLRAGFGAVVADDTNQWPLNGHEPECGRRSHRPAAWRTTSRSTVCGRRGIRGASRLGRTSPTWSSPARTGSRLSGGCARPSRARASPPEPSVGIKTVGGIRSPFREPTVRHLQS